MDDFLVVGEALVDIVEGPGRTPAEHPGGSPLNVSIGLARLGHTTQLLTRIGDDERGHAVRDHVLASGVRLVQPLLPQARTSTATARLDAHGIASYEFDLDWRIPTDVDPGNFRALHTGSIAAFLSPGDQSVLDLVAAAKGRATVSYDPNARPTIIGERAPALARVEEIVASADVVKVSDEDLAWLLPGERPRSVARRWLDAGPSVVVVTEGGAGAFGVVRAGEVDAHAPPIQVADTVGAGDAFMSGLLDRLAQLDLLGHDRLDALRDLDTHTLRAVVDHAVRVAAFTCTRHGAQPPTRQELADWWPEGPPA
jgi:fructokinase